MKNQILLCTSILWIGSCRTNNTNYDESSQMASADGAAAQSYKCAGDGISLGFVMSGTSISNPELRNNTGVLRRLNGTVERQPFENTADYKNYVLYDFSESSDDLRTARAYAYLLWPKNEPVHSPSVNAVILSTMSRTAGSWGTETKWTARVKCVK